MSIRIRHPGGTATLGLSETTDLAALQSFIAEQCQITPSEQELKTGYPPRSVSLHGIPSTTLLSEAPLRIKKGEQIIVAIKSSTSSSATTSTRGGATPPQQNLSRSSPQVKRQRSMESSGTSSQTAAPPQPGLVDTSTPQPAAPQPASKAVTSSKPPASTPAMVQPPSTSTAKDSTPIGVKPGEVISVPLAQDSTSTWEGHLTLQLIPDDNSCLFSAVSLLLTQTYSAQSVLSLRKVVSETILQDRLTYSEVLLGQPPQAYAEKILQDRTWGGGIELAILSDHHRVELAALDVANGVSHIFGQGKGYTSRGYLVYSGIHYDALALLPHPSAPLEFATTLFESSQSPPPTLTQNQLDLVDSTAMSLVKRLKERRYYTDTARFTLRCGQCATRLKGQKEATEHAMSTGHTDFREYE